MSSHSLPMPFRHTRGRLQLGIGARIPSLRTAVFIIIAVLILFRWLNLILALEITRTGRQIQTTTEELHRQERDNAGLRLAIAEAESPLTLAEAATQLGYKPRAPVYIRVDEPLADRSTEAGVGTSFASSLATDKAAQGPALAGQSMPLVSGW